MIRQIRLLALALLFLAIFSGAAVSSSAQTPDETQTSGSAESPALKKASASLDGVLTDVESVKKERIKAEKRVIEVVREKSEIAREQQKLEKSASQIIEFKDALSADVAEKALALQEKLKTVEKTKITIETKEQTLRKTIEAYEKIARLVEQKLKILGNDALTFRDIQNEIQSARKETSGLNKEKLLLKQAVGQLEREAQSVEQAIVAKKFLFQIKGDGAKTPAWGHDLGEERLEASNTAIRLLKDFSKLIDLQSDIEEDYLLALKQIRREKFRLEFLTPHPPAPHSFDAALCAIALVLLLFWIRLGVKIESFLGRFSPVLSGAVLILKARALFGLCALLVPGYAVAWYAGYQSLGRFVLTTLILMICLHFAFGFLHLSLHMFLRKIIAKEKHLSLKEANRKYPAISIMSMISGWFFMCLGVWIVLNFWGLSREGLGLAKIIITRPLFTMGTVNLSVWTLLKSCVVAWVFVLIANAFENLLKKSVYPKTHLDDTVKHALAVLLKYLVMITGGLTCLKILGIEMGALAVFAGTLGIGIGLGLQEIAKNFISGLIMLIERPIKIGDFIEVGNLPGQVRDINARSTVVDTFDNIQVVVPNSEFMTERIVNWSYRDRVIRMAVTVGVAYGSDTELVRRTLLEVAKEHPDVLEYPAPMVWFEAFGESSLNFRLLAWTNRIDSRQTVISELNFAIDRKFRDRGITIPFPQRDLHIRTSETVIQVRPDKTV